MRFSTIRIRSGLKLRQICLLLPSSPDREHTGYITKTRIRHKTGGYGWIDTDYSKPLPFHTHPANAAFANIPSLRDIRNFLLECDKTSIIVGGSVIWIWTHTKKSKQIAKIIGSWESDNMVKYLKKHTVERYLSILLRKFGFRKPHTIRLSNWQKQLDNLGIKSELVVK